MEEMSAWLGKASFLTHVTFKCQISPEIATFFPQLQGPRGPTSRASIGLGPEVGHHCLSPSRSPQQSHAALRLHFASLYVCVMLSLVQSRSMEISKIIASNKRSGLCGYRIQLILTIRVFGGIFPGDSRGSHGELSESVSTV